MAINKYDSKFQRKLGNSEPFTVNVSWIALPSLANTKKTQVAERRPDWSVIYEMASQKGAT
jgi:hypothetical protein